MWYLVIIGVVVIGLTVATLFALTNDTTTDAPSYVPAFDSPGGNSLVVPAAATDAYIPAFNSPGGNSLTIAATSSYAYGAAFDSPGGHSLNLAASTGGYVLAEGPGGHSLNIP